MNKVYHFPVLLTKMSNTISHTPPHSFSFVAAIKQIVTLAQSKKTKGSSESHSPHGTRIFVQWACVGHQPGSPWLVNMHYGNKVFIGAIQHQGGKSRSFTTLDQVRWSATKLKIRSLRSRCSAAVEGLVSVHKPNNEHGFHTANTASTWKNTEAKVKTMHLANPHRYCENLLGSAI